MTSESAPVNSPPRKDGMRVLSASASYVLSEKGNVVTLEYGTDGYGGAPADFEVTVPRDDLDRRRATRPTATSRAPG